MIKKVLKYIRQNQLIDQGDRIIAGVSGGADSVCLLFMLLKIREIFSLELFAVHVHHGLRGQEADGDALFVKELCAGAGVEYIEFRENICDYAAKYHISEEEAGRKVRYEAFERVKQEKYGNKIAVAHNKNDDAETILFHLFRGSGMKGLSGISAVRDYIIRPLLCLTRNEIEEWLLHNGKCFRTDHTNLQDVYTRNKIRLHILPYAQENINGKSLEHIAEAGQEIRDVFRYIGTMGHQAYLRCVREEEGKIYISVCSFLKEDEVLQAYLIRECLEKLAGGLKDIVREHISMIQLLFLKESGKEFDLPMNLSARRKYEEVILEKREKEIEETEKQGVLKMFLFENENNLEIPQKLYTKWFDYDKIKGNLQLRTRQPGDFLVIHENGNKKKLKDYLINCKVDRKRRDKILLLAAGNEILWIVGYRTSEAYKVTNQTKQILCVEYTEKSEDSNAPGRNYE